MGNGCYDGLEVLQLEYHEGLEFFTNKIKHDVELRWREWYYTKTSYEEVDKWIWKLIDSYNIDKYMPMLALSDIKYDRFRDKIFDIGQKETATYFGNEEADEYEYKLSMNRICPPPWWKRLLYGC